MSGAPSYTAEQRSAVTIRGTSVVVSAGAGCGKTFVLTERFGDEVVVGGTSAAQIAEIVNQDSFKGRIEVAKDFAVLNNMAESLPGRQILAAIGSRVDDLVTIPKPVLTSREKTVKKPADRVKDEVRVALTIVVTGAE